MADIPKLLINDLKYQKTTPINVLLIVYCFKKLSNSLIIHNHENIYSLYVSCDFTRCNCHGG